MIPLAAVFFAIYVAISVVIGVVASRRETEDDFMIAGRRVHGFQMMATMAAGWFDGVTLSVYLAYVYLYGFSALSLFGGIAAGFLLFRKFAPRIKQNADKMNAYSMPEYFYRIFGRKNGIMFSIFLITQFFGYLVINLILSGKVLSTLFPFLGYPMAVMIGGVIILTYLILGGFKAVVRTDVYQLIIMIFMTVFVSSFFVQETVIVHEDFDIGRMGVGNVIGFLVIAGFGVMVAPDIWQRVFAARDEKTLKRGFAYSALILPLLAIVITTVGLATKQLLPGIPAEDALVKSFHSLLPRGFMEFAMVLLYAVSLSSSDTVTFVISSIITRDLKNYSTRFTHESMKKITRVAMILLVSIALLVAITYQQIIHIALSLGSLNLALFPVVFASMYWTLHRNAVFWSLIIVLISVGALSMTGELDPETAALSLPIALISLVILQMIFRRRKDRAPTAAE